MMEITRTQFVDLPFVLINIQQGKDQLEQETAPIRRGDLCPACLKDLLDYNGLLNLECNECRYTVGGCFT
jgi:hypothetical protein